jgi:hypothetical protein
MKCALLSLCLLAACSSGSGAPPQPTNGGNGVDDVKQACLLQGQWTHPLATNCVQCKYFVGVAACACDPNPQRGMCLMQNQAMTNEPDCGQQITSCVMGCGTDCNCVDACYSGHAACRSAASALDGCTVAVCDSTCK